MIHKATVAFQEASLPFLVGSFNQVANSILQKAGHQSRVVLPCDLHNVVIFTLRPSLRSAYRAIDACTTDGMPLVWMWRYILGNHRLERVYGPDLFLWLLRESEKKGLRQFFFGGTTRTQSLLLHRLKEFTPNLVITGVISPPFKPLTADEKSNYLQMIKKAQPDFLWIGIGSPAQVLLASEWKEFLPRTTIMCVGAAFNFVSGSVAQAPTWIQRAGLEWLFRLLMEPRRLAGRYLLKIPLGICFLVILKLIAPHRFNKILTAQEV